MDYVDDSTFTGFGGSYVWVVFMEGGGLQSGAHCTFYFESFFCTMSLHSWVVSNEEGVGGRFVHETGMGGGVRI